MSNDGAHIIDFNSAKPQELAKIGIDVDDLKSRLNASAREFVEWLYSGRAVIARGGSEARIGDVEGAAGASLSIHLTGPHTGLWKDHATDEGGDLITLYRLYMGYSDTREHFLLVIKEIAREFFHDPIEFERPVWTPSPSAKIRDKKEKYGDKPRDEDRELLGAPEAIYHYFDVQNNIIAKVMRYPLDGTDEHGKAKKTFRPHCFKEIDGKKKWIEYAAPEGDRPLYRLPQIVNHKTIVLVEGEKCADALASIGIEEVTTAMSGSNAPLEKTDWSPLKGKTVIIWPDNDKTGLGYARDLAVHLHALGCDLLGIDPPADKPTKWDAADCIKEGGDAKAIIAAAKPIYPEDIGIKPKIAATPYRWIDPSRIPRRDCLYASHFFRKFGSATISQSGVGKSSLALTEALAMASNRALIGEVPKRRLRVWYWNGEDPKDELDRRIAAICKRYKLTKDDVDDWLFIDSGRDQEIILAVQTRDGARIAEPVVESLIKTIKDNAIDVVIIDPFIASHRVTENDNVAIERVAKQWTSIADYTNTAIELVHHSRKTGGEAVTVEDGRGASAMLAAVRSARVLNIMTKEEATKAGVKPHRAYFRLENGKSNLAPPPEEATWFHICSVVLGNGEGLLDKGDSVGVIENWKWPDPLEGMTGKDFVRAAGLIKLGTWRKDMRATNWVGVPIAKALNLDLNNPEDRQRVVGIVRVWLAAGSLEVYQDFDERRNKRDFVRVRDDDDD